MTRTRLLFFIREGWWLDKFSWLSSPLLHPYSLFMVVTQFLRSAVGLIMYLCGVVFRFQLTPGPRTLSVLADEHLISGYDRYGTKAWAVVYPLLSFLLVGALIYFGGWEPILYLLMAQVFMTGFLHPVMFGLILSNSHFHGHEKYQPSASYYGWLNWITFNFGLHTEHHDLASVPWNLLPELSRIAPEFYDDLVKTPSYSWLAYKFTFCNQRVLKDAFINPTHQTSKSSARDSAPNVPAAPSAAAN